MTCYFCQRTTPPGTDSLWADAHGWDWFTGCLAFTVHVCPQCVPGKRCAAKRAESLAKPAAGKPLDGAGESA